ncbi:MAG: B12-binding domain-containing radical SAM protein [Deltaproteobacteria bacterium]|nr:B12-binding domain-containing radical SAM protein [Deltaproteobacteria bacterium]
MGANAILVDLGPIYSHDPKRNGLNDNLGLGYISAYCRSAGHDVEILSRGDSRFTLEEMAHYILFRGFKVVGVSLTQERVNLGTYFIELLRNKGCPAHITLGGYLPTLAPKTTLEVFAGVDSLVMNEGELTFAALLHALENDQPLELPGLMTREALRDRIYTPRPLIRDLDALPFPDRPGQTGPSEVTWLYSSRGCSSHCTFCSIHVFYQDCGWRPRTARNVVDEIEYLVKNRGVREIQFCDDNFLCGPKGVQRAKKIAAEIIKRKINISFTIECRLESVRVNLFKLLRKAGLDTVLVGVESLDDSSLGLFQKPRPKGLLERALNILDSLKIQAHLGFIMFNPASTLESVRRNMMFLKSRSKQGKMSPWEMFLCYTSILQPNIGTTLVQQLLGTSQLVETSPLKLEMHFTQPSLEGLLEVRNFLRYHIANFVYNVRSMFRTDLYSPEMVEAGEKLVDESHAFGVEMLDYFSKKFCSASGSIRNEVRVQEKLLAKLDRINAHAERYFNKFKKAVEFRFHGMSENGYDHLYNPTTNQQIALPEKSLELLHFWQYRCFRTGDSKKYHGNEPARQACEGLLTNGLLASSPTGEIFNDTEISPFILWDAFEMVQQHTERTSV